MSQSSPDFSIQTLSFPDAPDSPSALLVDDRIVPYLPLPVRPARSTPLHQDGKPSFEIRPAGVDRGLGMFATRHIPAGALILVEHPAILTPAKVPLTRDARDAVYRDLFAALPEHRRNELRTMTNCRSLDECETMEEGIARTNGTAVELGHPDEIEIDAREYGAVFLTINRSNHSCGPNAAHKWDLASFSSSLYALRPIEPAEEITMIYTDVTQPRDTRRERLLAHYGFTCMCEFCTLPPSLSAESDAARAALREWRHTRPVFAGWATDLCRADDFVLKSHMQALELIEKEGLQGMESAFVRDVCLCWAVLGEEAKFREWAKKLERLSDVRDVAMAREVRGWLQDPKGRVPKWGWRSKRRLQTSKKKVLEEPESYYSPLLF
ncbi:hypothetical protein D9615_009159 [Tricholomella constricta]|uniref:SET domain-containing protein n=1 Tax=Tricholomella constricta TaxID=117010 RepID=A0A8H5H2P2_9AGAR|nr:hypothetical protein D9615_009159 [Tricholomella constricta]